MQFIVPWPPGDLEDVPTRMIAEETGALVYWQGADQAAARIDADYEKIEEMFKRMGDLQVAS